MTRRIRSALCPLLPILVAGLLVMAPRQSGARTSSVVPSEHGSFAKAKDGLRQEPRVIEDGLGRPFALPRHPPERIVSLAPNVTEILFALGLGDRIVGVTRFCDHPAGTAGVRKVGGLVDPNIEIVRSLDPDLVIGFRGNPLRVLDRIAKLGLPVFVLDIGEGLETLFPLIAKLGVVTRAEDRAARLSAGLMERVEAVGAATAGVEHRPRVFVLLYGQGLWTCGGQSYLDDLITRAGAVNVASGLPKKWALYKRERILKDDPEVIFVLTKSETDFAAARDWLRRKARVESAAAVRTGRIHPLDEDAASRFGPRLVDVLESMARYLHPERYGEGA